jgi:hypothetical protein
MAAAVEKCMWLTGAVSKQHELLVKYAGSPGVGAEP